MDVNLSTTYMGLKLRNPLVIAASPLSAELHNLEQLEQSGAAAVVLWSLFAEQIEQEAISHPWLTANGQEDQLIHFPMPEAYSIDADGYLRHLELAKRVVKIPIIGSLNGTHRGQWIEFARLIEQAGADALELNIYFVPTDPIVDGSCVEDQYVELISAVRAETKLPLAVKFGPFFSSLPHVAARFIAAGANGLVLFNRFLQPDIDLTTLEVSPTMHLSTSDELRLPLRWIAILRSQLSISLAATSGVHTTEDVLKLLLAGADVVMLASTLIRNGPEHLETMLRELSSWLNQRGYGSLDQICGLLSQRNYAHPQAYERANYVKTLASVDPQRLL